MLVAFIGEQFLVWEPPPPRSHVLSQNMDILDREKFFCLGFHWNFIDISKAPEIESTQYCPIMQSFL